MANLMEASRQWASRPDDERFLSLTDLANEAKRLKAASAAKVVASREIKAAPIHDDKGLGLVGPSGKALVPTHWAFGQLAARAGAPAGYLRELPSPLAADCINFGLMTRDVEEVGIFLQKPNGTTQVAAVTGPNYGRIWNSDIATALVERFGDGLTGDFTVPGIFGKKLTENTKRDTTFYLSDRDMFVFLADEQNRIEMKNRRDGQPGALARGFFVKNSEVGAATFEIDTFLFDYVCGNRIVWGAEEVKTFRIRHTSGAPHRWVEEAVPALREYAESSTASVTAALEAARAKRLGSGDAVRKFLEGRFTKSQATAILAAHEEDEGRPIETMWDAVVGATAYARGIKWQDERVKIERAAGQIIDLAA
jgi:hypothetical protein